MKMTRKYFLLLLFTITYTLCKAQEYDGSVNSLIQVAGKYQANHTPEKLYLQFDKSNYNLGDTLWFKAYLFNASLLRASAKSNIVYIEISDESNTLFTRRMMFITGGTGIGSIALKGDNFPEGAYTLRAYTEWMRNFNQSYIFKKQFYINAIDKYNWLISYSKTQNHDAQLRLQVKQMDNNFVSNQPIQLGIKQGDAVLRWDKIEPTSPLGSLDFSISPKNSQEPIYATLQKATGKDADVNAPIYKFPLIINRPEKIDLQFMPEGGYMVAGINTTIGFKAIGEDGMGTDIAGTITNNRNEPVVTFKSAHKGMGNFAFKPVEGMAYTAVVDLPDGSKKTYLLPAVKPGGTVLNVVNNEEGDSVAIKVSATNNDGRYLLLGQSRGLICYGAHVYLINNIAVLKAPNSAFASGVVTFTLLNEQFVTLNERMIYIDHHDNLQINITPDKNSYSLQDSIALHLDVKDADGKPVQGHFSMSVVNNLQLNNSKDSASIVCNVLLTSDLKGNIEDPTYYFNNNLDRYKALDNLMLTQGWTGFDWKNLFLPVKPPVYAAETTFDIGGKVTGLLGKSKGVNVNLFTLRPVTVNQTNTDQQGIFSFKNLIPVDSVAYFIHATTAGGGDGTYGVDLDKPEWPLFAKNKPQMPWYVNANETILKTADTLIKNQYKQAELNGTGKMLKEVNIVEKKIVKGSHNLNGPGNADQVLDSKDIDKAGKVTLLELIQQQVKGFRTIGIGMVSRYYIRTEPIGGFIFDGIAAPKYIRSYEWLTNYTAEDIKGIEVMSVLFTSYYESKYNKQGLFPVPFIEITTRDGIGPVFRKKHPSFVTYVPPLLISAKEFYRPAYPVKNSVVASNDQRTTIHWEPNIITDSQGKATVTFYAAGQPATYTITTEGSNMNGNVGSTAQKITIKATQP